LIDAMAQNFDNLDWTDGQHSIPGIFEDVFFIEKSKITSWPSLPSAPTSSAAEVTYEGDFALSALALWKKINCIDVKSQPSSEPQGELRCKTFLNKVSLVISLTNEKATAFAKLANNTDLVYLFKEKDSSKYRVAGCEMFAIMTKASINIGKEPSAERGTTIEIEASDIVPFPFYDGEILTADGDINPSA
jgi:hypothetical protein